MNGLICSKGRETGVPTPFHDAIVDTMHGIDDGSLKPDPSNVDIINEGRGVVGSRSARPGGDASFPGGGSHVHQG